MSVEESRKVAKQMADEFVRQKEIWEAVNEEDPDAAHDFLYEEGEITDPETGEEVIFDKPYGIDIEKRAILVLAGGGPSINLVVTLDNDDNSPSNISLQHAWWSEWEDLNLTGAQQDVLEWYVQHLGLDAYLEI